MKRVRRIQMSGSDVEGHMTSCFPVSNMAAEDLPSEFDVVILGTGRDKPDICWDADPDLVFVGVYLLGVETPRSCPAHGRRLFSC